MRCACWFLAAALSPLLCRADGTERENDKEWSRLVGQLYNYMDTDHSGHVCLHEAWGFFVRMDLAPKDSHITQAEFFATFGVPIPKEKALSKLDKALSKLFKFLGGNEPKGPTIDRAEWAKVIAACYGLEPLDYIISQEEMVGTDGCMAKKYGAVDMTFTVWQRHGAHAKAAQQQQPGQRDEAHETMERNTPGNPSKSPELSPPESNSQPSVRDDSPGGEPAPEAVKPPADLAPHSQPSVRDGSQGGESTPEADTPPADLATQSHISEELGSQANLDQGDDGRSKQYRESSPPTFGD